MYKHPFTCVSILPYPHTSLPPCYTEDRSVLWQAILLLEYVRSTKTSNAQIMLLLLKLYGHLGVAECITDIFEALNIKHLQMETLG